MEHKSTVAVEEIQLRDQFDDGVSDTIYNVVEILRGYAADGAVTVRVMWNPSDDPARVDLDRFQWMIFPAGTLLGLLNR